jgi:hypothetical protein
MVKFLLPADENVLIEMLDDAAKLSVHAFPPKALLLNVRNWQVF